MPFFTEGFNLNSQLEKIFKEAKKYLILISPFIKLHPRYASVLLDKIEDYDFEIIIVFGKNETDLGKSMNREDFEFFSKFPNIEIRYQPNLHAKYYANENSAIITSMNLYTYSQENNIEAGVVTSRKGMLSVIASSLNPSGSDDIDYDAAVFFDQVIKQADLLFKKEPIFEPTMLGLSSQYVSSEITVNNLPFSFQKANKQTSYQKNHATENKPFVQNSGSKIIGYCIRTKAVIPFNPKHPMCETAFQSWKRFSNNDYPEKYCHFSGEVSNGQTSFAKPILRKYWKKAQEIHGF